MKEKINAFLAHPLWRDHRVLMVFVFVLSSLSPSDLFPAYLRKEWVQPYALKALPVTLVWLKLCYEMITKDYQAITQIAN